ITQCGDLCDRVDLSAQVYPRGSHLLCHDDVIGTRKVSFIYYLTDPEEDWSSAEGGALELYPRAGPGTPAVAPSKELLPLADSLAIFLVEPGVSFHAVREVRGERARVSLQGWLHARSLEETLGFESRQFATLQQILVPKEPCPAVVAAPAGGQEEDSNELSEEDLKVLSEWISPAYLSPQALQ
ncbi:unnamed protein product, partial [Polarella glacialis]